MNGVSEKAFDNSVMKNTAIKTRHHQHPAKAHHHQLGPMVASSFIIPSPIISHRMTAIGPQIRRKDTHRTEQCQQATNVSGRKILLLKIQAPKRHDAANQRKIQTVEVGETPLRQSRGSRGKGRRSRGINHWIYISKRETESVSHALDSTSHGRIVTDGCSWTTKRLSDLADRNEKQVI